MTSLYHIIKTNDAGKLEEQIKNNTDVNQNVNVGHKYNLLTVSIVYDAWECFLFLINKGADINRANFHMTYPIESALERSLKKGDNKYLDILYKRLDLNPIYGVLKLTETRKLMDINLLNKMLEHPNAKKYIDLNFEAKQMEKNLINLGMKEVFETILKLGYQLNLQFMFFEMVETRKNVDCLILLINNGMKINDTYSTQLFYEDYYPLILAVKYENTKLIKCLIENGININVVCKDFIDSDMGKITANALFMAVSLKFIKAKDHLKYSSNVTKTIVNMLIKAGCDVNYVCPETGRSVLEQAIFINLDIKIINMIEKAGAVLDNTKKYTLKVSDWVDEDKFYNEDPVCKYLMNNGVKKESIKRYDEIYYK